MPKILRILNRFNLGGPTYNATYLTKYLDDDYETLLIGGEKDESEASSLYIPENLGLKPIVIKEMKRSIHPLNDYRSYKRIKKIIQEFQPDIVHTHASKAGAIGRLAAINCNVKIIVHTFHGHVFHSYFNPLKSKMYKGIERYLAKRSQAIVAISDVQKHELCHDHNIASSEKIKVIPLGFDLNKFAQGQDEKRAHFRSQYHLEESTIAIGIIGRLVPIKNHEMFIASAAQLKQNTQQPIQFFIIGDGEERENIEQLCERFQLTYDNKGNNQVDVVFTSWIKSVDWALAGLDIICLTSLNEGTPVSLIEAQAAGKPIVSTNVGGIENVVLKDKSALLCAVNDINAFVGHLTRLVNDKTLYSNMSSVANDFVMKRFHYTTLTNNMERLYTSLLDKQDK